MRLNKIVIDNFKGIKHFELAPMGGSITVLGDNATGKTSVADAVTWLLFDKDTDGRKAFSVIPLDAAGRTIPGMEPTVYAEFDCITLKKVYREVWTRRRGEAEAFLSGHTTDFEINGMPVAAKEYQARVNELCPKELVPILSDPLYFCHSLAWQERRTVLLDMAGELTDEEVFAVSDGLAGLLRDRATAGDLTEEKVYWNGRRKAANEELALIPARIEELSRQIEDEPEDSELLAAEAAMYQKSIDALRNPEKENEALRDAKEALRIVLDEKRDYVSAEQDRMLSERRAQDAQIAPVRDELRKAEDSFTDAHRIALRAELEAEKLENRLNDLREKWDAEDAKEWSGDTVCPTCGQELPAERIETAKAAFADMKNAALDEIEKQASEVADALAGAQKKQKAAKTETVRAEKRVLDLKKKLDEVSGGTVEESPDFAEKVAAYNARIEAAGAIVRQIEDGQNTTRREAAEKIAAAKEQIHRIQRLLTAPERNEAIRARQEELHDRQRELGDILAQSDRMVMACEDFLREKCRLTQARIDTLFSGVSFRLFRDQVNGGMADCCDAMIEGVPYDDANNAAKINAGLEIISKLAAYYGKNLPVLVDNAEAVTALADTGDLQLIRLYVSAEDKTLRVSA